MSRTRMNAALAKVAVFLGVCAGMCFGIAGQVLMKEDGAGRIPFLSVVGFHVSVFCSLGIARN